MRVKMCIWYNNVGIIAYDTKWYNHYKLIPIFISIDLLCSVAAVDRLEEVTDGQLTGIDFWRSRSRLEIAVTSPYGHDHGQAV